MNKQLILSNIFERFVGTKETIDFRRKMCHLIAYIAHNDREDIFITGSIGEGFLMKGSDLDIMTIFRNAMVMYPELYTHIHQMNFGKTVFFLRKINCRPGYVNLELAEKGTYISNRLMREACIGYKGGIFISSDKFREGFAGDLEEQYGKASPDKGPCRTQIIEEQGLKVDSAPSFACLSWPKEATEWISRTRLYGWPAADLIKKIVENGCHVVPVGDKCCKDRFVQWRLSFATAEKQLVHSLNHSQMKVYGLLKYLLKQIESLLQTLTNEGDILCSYFLKTIIFYAVENSPASLWQEHLTFTCFVFCLDILIEWVKASYCPQYFIPTNNLFLRKIHGENQEKLLHFLVSLRDVKLDCLSIGTFFKPTIGAVLMSLDKSEIPYSDAVYLNHKGLECERDFHLFLWLRKILLSPHILNFQINRVMSLLTRSQADEYDTVIIYLLASILMKKPLDAYSQVVYYESNRYNYSHLRRCQHLLTPMASLNTSPGKLNMATFFYLRGNYKRSICLCSQMTSSFKLFPVGDLNEDEKDFYQNTCCGKGYSLFKKIEDVVFEIIMTKQFCPQEIVLEVEKQPFFLPLHIPPLPYAVFLSFLCYHHIGDTRRRDESLGNLLTLCRSGEKQSGRKYWIVHSLLGICYQRVGDYIMAIGAFEDSLKVSKHYNPAEDRIVDCYESLKRALNLRFTC